jgi:hypothetical protein
MNELRKPYRRQASELHLAVEEARALREDLAEQRAALPELCQTCETGIFPLFRRWTADMWREIKPLDTKPLRRRAKSLRGLLRQVLTNRRAMRIILGNMLIRLGLLVVFLAKLGILALIIWGAVKLGGLLTQ